MNDHAVLTTVMDTYPHTAEIKSGAVRSSRLEFDFREDFRPVHSAFKQMVREDAFDLSELAAATAIQAISVGKPLVLLPAVMLSRFHHGSLVTTSDSGLSPAELSGRTVAVRSYAQTTGLWARGVLSREYDVDLDSVTWVVFEEGHVAECRVPANVRQAPAGTSIEQLLLAGEVDAAIVGRQRSGDPRIVPLIPDHKERALEWFARTRIMPVNHMLVLSRRVIDRTPWVVDELWRLLTTARERYLRRLQSLEPAGGDEAVAQSFARGGYDPLPFGIDALGPTLSFAADLCVEQRLIDAPLSLDDLFPPSVRHLR